MVPGGGVNILNQTIFPSYSHHFDESESIAAISISEREYYGKTGIPTDEGFPCRLSCTLKRDLRPHTEGYPDEKETQPNETRCRYWKEPTRAEQNQRVDQMYRNHRPYAMLIASTMIMIQKRKEKV